MEKKHNISVRALLWSLIRYWWVWCLAAVMVSAAVLLRQCRGENAPVQLKVEHDTRIDLTPEEIRSIKDIGEWEFLSVHTEELVQWQRKRTLGLDMLVRIYTGTLRLGIRMDKTEDDWLIALPDSVVQIKLPPIELLDSNFVHEAESRTFYEKGSIPAEARENLYEQARERMMKRCLTSQNLQSARKNAEAQFTRIFQGWGAKKVVFSPPAASK